MTAHPALQHRTQKQAPPAHLGMALIGFETNLISRLLAFREVNKWILQAPSEMQRDPSAAAL